MFDPTLQSIALIFFGGGLGSVSRFLLGRYFFLHVESSFPWATLVINTVGCLVIGLVSGLFNKHPMWPIDLRLMLTAGFCGGFTTFSSFSYENVVMWQKGNYFFPVLNSFVSIIFGFLATLAGITFGKWLP